MKNSPNIEAHSTIKFVFVLLVSATLVVLVALASYAFFGTREQEPLSAQEQQRQYLTQEVKKLLAERENIPPSQFTVLVEKYNTEYIRAAVKKKGESQSGLVFLTAAFGDWEIVHTGVSPASCKMLYQFAFPKEFIVECSTDPRVAEAQMKMHAL